jgi:SRSO17 transposase
LMRLEIVKTAIKPPTSADNPWPISARSTTAWSESTSLWADERVYYPLEVEPYTPESYFAKGKKDPQFRTKLKIALELVKQAIQERIPFRAMVADCFDGEDRDLKRGWRQLKVPYVMALNPSHAWWHPEEVAGTLQDVAREAGPVACRAAGKVGCASPGRGAQAVRRTGGRWRS